MVSAARLCLICKGGRALCGNKTCPLLPRLKIQPELQNVNKDFFGPSHSLFVGRIGYPSVNIGPLAAMHETPNIDNPRNWFGAEYGEIVKMRSLMIRSKQKESIFSKSKFIQENQEIALAKKPTDIEMKFRNRPVYRMSFSDIIQPMGPTAPLKEMKMTENPKISRRVEYIVHDEIKANEAGFLLYKSNQDVYKISTILSSGVMGMERNKKLVPTRWSITAVDDMIAKELMKNIRTYSEMNNYHVYESQYLDNHFVILLMPGSWEFENFEAWAPGSFWSQNLKKPEILREYEAFGGRTDYAEIEAGGYYASRIACIENLNRIKRQAKVVVFREVYEGYVIPLGVWVVRETARNAFKNKPVMFSTRKKALEYIKTRLRIPLHEYTKISTILQQKRLMDFV